MHDEIHKVLNFSRHFVDGLIDLQDCPHQGYFDKYDCRCVNCEQSLECQWLNQEHNFSLSRHRPAIELMKTLESAIYYVDTRLSMQEHDLAVCHCEACVWLRCAERLFEQGLESHLRCLNVR